MANEETVNRVGVGVDLFGGPDVLTNLRSIRQEMLAINQLAQSTKIPNNISGLGTSGGNRDPRQQQLFDFERESKASNERIVRDKTETYRKLETAEQAHQRKMTELRKPVSDQEVTFEITKNNRKKSLDEKVFQETEAQAEKRRNAIVRQLQTEHRLDQEDIKQRDEFTARYRQWSINQLKAEEEHQKRSEALRNRPRNEKGQFLSNDAIQRQQEQEQARQTRIIRAQEQPRDDSGKFISRAENERRQDEARLRLEQQQETEKRQRESERVAREAEQRQAQRQRQIKLEQQAIDDRIRNESATKQATADVAGARYSQSNYRKSSLDLFKAQNPIAGPGTSSNDDFLDFEKATQRIDKVRDRLLSQRNSLGGKQFALVDGNAKKDIQEIYVGFQKLGERAVLLREELNSVNMKRAKHEIVSDLKEIENEELSLINQTRKIRETQLGLTGTKDPKLRDTQGLVNEKGFFTSADALGRITRNILLYEVVSRASYGLVDYIGKSVDAAKRTVEFSNALRFATESAHGNLQANNELVESIRPFGLSRQQGRQTVTEAARFTENRPQDINKLVDVSTNIAAERGGGIDKTDELIEQLRRRESKFYKRIFGKTVEEIYQDDAETKVRASTSRTNVNSQGLVVGENSSYFKTQKQQISEYVGAMTDAQKEASVLNYVLSQQGRFAGEAAQRAETLAGRIDRINASFANAQEGVGLFITEIKPLNALFESLAGKVGILDKLRPPDIKRSGPGGTITNDDIQTYGRERVDGGRGQLLNFINDNGATLVAGAGLAGAAGLIGRNTAKEQYRTNVYNKRFAENRLNIDKFGDDIGAAQNDAIEFAKGSRTGVIRSVRAGMEKLTVGVNASIGEMFDTAVGALRTYGFIAPKLSVTSGLSPSGLARPISGGTSPTGTVNGNLLGLAYTGRGSFGQPGLNYGSNLEGINYQSAVARVGIEGEENLTARGSAQRNARLAREDYLDKNLDKNRRTGGTIGGITGGIVGAEIGNFVANQFTANSLVVTTLTLVGGLAGSTALTELGSRGFGAVTRDAAGAGGFGSLLAGGFGAGGAGAATTGTGVGIAALIGAGIGLFLSDKIPGTALYAERQDEHRTKIIEEGQGAFQQQARERAKAISEGRNRYFSNIQGDTLESLTGEQVAERVANKKGTLADYRESLILETEFTSLGKKQAQELADRAKFYRDIKDQTGKVREQSINQFNAEQENSYIDNFGGGKASDEARTHFAESTEKRLQQEAVVRAKFDQVKQEAVNQQANALGKLRDAQEGSFRQVETVAQHFAGADNPYVKIFSEGATAAQRMQQQYGFLGKTTVDYFTNIERQNVALATTKARFASIVEQQGLLNKAGQERDQRNIAPGLSTRQGIAGDILQASQSAIVSVAQLQDQYKDVQFGKYRYQYKGDREYQQRQQLKSTLSKLNISGLLGLGFGATGRQESDITSQNILSLFQQSGLNPNQIENDPYLKDTYLRANRNQQSEQFAKVQDSIKKSQLQDNEDARLRNDLARVNGQFGGAKDQATKDELNKFIIGRTDGINPKDLSLEQFQQRQSALQQEARRSVEREEEARRAVLQGLEYQKQMNESLGAIRAAIVGGDLSMLIQVQNDSQARVDQQSLKDSNPGFKVALDQGQTKTNPNTPVTSIYKPGAGRK